MKKTAILLIVTIIFSLFSLASCKKNEYEPVESTELEATEVMSFTLDGESYSVRYELYRALFLNYKTEIDGGDDSVWTGADKEEYIAEIDEKIIEAASRIYSAIAAAKKIGYDPYSAKVEADIKELIRQSVEGGTRGGVTVGGYDSYQDYLHALKEMNLNYSVQVLLYRYALAIEALEEYYIGTASAEDIENNESKPGAIQYTKDTVREFYESDECVRVIRMQLQTSYDKDPSSRLERAREAVLSAVAGGESAVIAAMIGAGSITAAKEMQDGFVIGKHNLDKGIYGELTEAAFGLLPYGVSEAIKINDGDESYHVILFRTDKSEEHFESCYSSILYIYLKNEVGKTLDDAAESMINSTRVFDFLTNLDRSTITME